MIGIVLLFVAGIFVAWKVDTNFIANRNPLRTLEGPSLIQVLEKSETYDQIKKGQRKEIHSARPDDRPDNRRDYVEQLGSGGDGGEVLRLDSRRKMR